MSTPEDLTPAETRVRGLLEQLRGAPPSAPGTDLVRLVVRRARWQRAVRAGLVAAGSVVGALADGVALLVRRRR